MQMKSSYRLIKWALSAGVVASLATACVVSEGDGNGDGTNIGDAGESSNAGKGGSSSAGSKATGGGGSSSAGSNANGGTPDNAGGMGDGGAAFVPGECQVTDPLEPTLLPSTAPGADDGDCLACMKAKCGTEWQACYGEVPTTACGTGSTAEELGQFDCVLSCYFDNKEDLLDETELLTSCAAGCTGACDLPNDETNALVECASAEGADGCKAVCFAPL